MSKIKNNVDARWWALEHCAIILQGFYESGSWPLYDERNENVFETRTEENRIMRAVKGVIMRLHKEADDIKENKKNDR